MSDANRGITLSYNDWIEREARLRLGGLFERQFSQEEIQRVRLWWQAVAAIMMHHGNEVAPGPLPPDLAQLLCVIAVDLSSGKSPALVKATLDRGRPKETLDLYASRVAAAAYVRAAEAGEIDDENPRKTIRERYGLKQGETLRRWIGEFENPAHRWPNAEAITAAMHEGAQLYRERGPTHAAQERRAKANH